MLPLAKKAKIDENTINFSLCILCQLVEKPKSYEKVLEFIEKRASYNDTTYPDIWNRLRNATADIFNCNSATWHRSCYQNTVHTGNILFFYFILFLFYKICRTKQILNLFKYLRVDWLLGLTTEINSNNGVPTKKTHYYTCTKTLIGFRQTINNMI